MRFPFRLRGDMISPRMKDMSGKRACKDKSEVRKQEKSAEFGIHMAVVLSVRRYGVDKYEQIVYY